MDLPTYTNIWRIEKRLYKLYDFRLPMPLPVATFGVALGVFVLWAVLLNILNAPFDFGNGWHLVLWVVPPGVITVLATRPVIEGKRLTELLLSQVRFFTEARVYTRMAPEYEPSEVRVSVRVWHRDPACGPLPLRRTDRVRAAREERAVEKADEALPLDPVPDAAPPLWHAPEPETEPVRERQGTHVPPEPEAPARDLEEDRERVPVFAAARSGGYEAAQASTGSEGAEPAEPRTFTRTSGQDMERYETPQRRSVGKRVMNYFGFGLDPAGGDGPGGTPDRDEGPPGSDDEGTEDDFDEPLFATEEDEQRDRDEWFASLRASSGETPVGLTSKGAYTNSDTGPMSSVELAEATRRESTRRRAEEVMAAPAPDTDESADAEESPAARRLRGRVQGIRVARELDERRTKDARVSDTGDTAERARTTERRSPARSERAVERAPTPPTRTRARGQAPQAPAPEDGAASPPTEPRRKSRPHAAPWELDRPGSEDGGGYPDVSDYAARYAAASGRPASDAPWLPPASAAPEEEATEPRPTEKGSRESEDRAPGEVWKASGTTHVEPREKTIAPVGEAETTVPGGPVGPDTETEPPAVLPPGQVWKRGPGKAPAVPELDHGTGEHEAMPPRPYEDAEEDRGPEWNEHMSVLEQHLIKADTPAPPRPKFADARPATERDNEHKDPTEWFEDGKKRHPDQPKVGDRGNPVIPARELREEREPVAKEAPGTGSKPPTQLDHGTGELVSFVEVREDPTRADRNTRADDPAPSVPRRTAADLERAEIEALERRRAARDDARPSPEEPTAPARDPRENQSLASLGRDSGDTEVDEETTNAEGRPAEEPADHTPDHSDPHDGMFHRVAQNARKLGQLFGQTVPGEEPESSLREGRPALELDHGTGEQERLGDTPHGVPSQRVQPSAEPSPANGTRGWRRLAKVVTGGSTPVRSDLPPGDIERLRGPLPGPRNLVVLGCTGGAGQTVTALMVGHTLAQYRDDKVSAVDVNPGPNGLSRRVGAQTPETLTALLANAETISEYEQMRSYVSRAESGLEVVQTLDDPYVQTLDDRDYGRLTELLGGFYDLTLLDPAATGVSRALPVADGLVLVTPAGADAERAVSMTFEWLDGNGYSGLRAGSVLVVNGVSKRSLPGVDAAERVARGRCRAIVRIPWDDHLGMSYTKIDVESLRPTTRRAHGALGGVIVSSLAD